MSKKNNKKIKIKNAYNLDGFSMIFDYISPAEENDLIKQINKQEWVVDYTR